MPRGLSDLQKKILIIIDDNQGGRLTEINSKIKSQLYPEFYYKGGKAKRLITWDVKHHYSRRENGQVIEDYPGYLRQCNQFLKIRVTISNSIAGLVRRGLITKQGSYNKYGSTYIELTEAGKRSVICIKDL